MNNDLPEVRDLSGTKVPYRTPASRSIVRLVTDFFGVVIDKKPSVVSRTLQLTRHGRAESFGADL